MRIWPYPPVLFLLMVLALHACREKDERFPSILIAQPGNGASYQVFDTVTVVYTASDETQLESVIGQLLDQNLIPIGPQVFADVVGNAFSGSFELVISDKLTPSGNYFIMVKAFDGTNEQREFVEIQIQAMPKLRRAVYAATAVQQSATIWKVDSLFQQAELWTSAGQDVLGLHVNSLEDRLSIAGRYSTALSTYSILSRTVVWNDQTFPLGQTERYTYLHGFKNTLYAGLYDRELRAYTSNGALTLIRPTGDFRPETIYADDTYLLVEMNLVGDDRHLIYVYNTLT
ncbi:MAG: hypothetical protein RL266_2786, partial [Bacteroidota bacterium]